MAATGFVANAGQGIVALVLVLIPTESVPSKFAGTAIGLSTLVGEVVGATLAPAISGAVADRHGLAAPLGIAAGVAVAVFLAGGSCAKPHLRKFANLRCAALRVVILDGCNCDYCTVTSHHL
jgi:sugar phosphate permease